MAQTPPPSGIKPLVKPVAKPADNPYANIQVAPRVAPTVNMVRPPLPVAKPPVAAPVAAPSQPKFGSPSAVGFNPAYTASNPVNANDRGGDRIQKMPREMMFDPQIQYNLLWKPFAEKYGFEQPASLLNPENYQYKNLQDGVSKVGNTLGNVTNLMSYGTPFGAAISSGFQAANTANALGYTAPQTALGAAGGAAAVTFAVKNILSKGTVAGKAGQTVIELAKLASIFGQPQIVNTVKNLTGVDISGYIQTAFNADIIKNQIPTLGMPQSSVVSNLDDPAFAFARSGQQVNLPGFREFAQGQISDALKNGEFTGARALLQVLPSKLDRPVNLIRGHGVEWPRRKEMLGNAIERTNELGGFDPSQISIRQDVTGIMGNRIGSEPYKPFQGRDVYLVDLENGDTIPIGSSTKTNFKEGVERRGSMFPFGGIQYSFGWPIGPNWLMKDEELIAAANASSYMRDLYHYLEPRNALKPLLANGDPNTLIEHGSLQETLRTIFGGLDINFDDPNVVEDIMRTIQNYEFYLYENLDNHMQEMARRSQ